MRFVIDMNLSAAWATELAKDGHDAVHWSAVGFANASDDEILTSAADDNRVVLTADLDFGTAVASRGLAAPAVVQIRDPNTDPDVTGAPCASRSKPSARHWPTAQFSRLVAIGQG